ncbi:hypothetical protein SODALDRAFT_284129 [Sodiomyces alkalinus F11]|uniref:BTB domain-containing protein n=1 Tax=Sodiomyces alkalinus (strain CBS 110278 / VKM F-3762 / F11) TaxID=1314773 RepID=A0A3N2PM44_SODAK|nr:hypothetical protein SODALDRAFT_284129 [Sodiomyces alkalinus F11]ROT35416.1 hypothetical protein SODALDRAFT_284129 [Sodiomyces alkalinus F11]
MDEQQTTENHRCVCLDPSGNVTLAFPDKKGSTSIQFVVSSPVLALASSYFRVLFESNFKEGLETKAGTFPRIELEEDDSEAMEAILSLLHFRNGTEYTTMKPEKLAAIALHCNKYQCTNALRPWLHLWLDSEKVPKAYDIGFLLSAAFFFEDAKHFRRISALAIRHVDIVTASLWQEQDVTALMATELHSMIIQSVRLLLDRLQGIMHSGEEMLEGSLRGYEMAGRVCDQCGRKHPETAKKCHPCGTSEIHKVYCTSQSRVAEYFILLRQNNLWPSVTRFRDSAAATLAAQFGTAASACRHQCSAGSECPLRTMLDRVSREMNRVLDNIQGVELKPDLVPTYLASEV